MSFLDCPPPLPPEENEESEIPQGLSYIAIFDYSKRENGEISLEEDDRISNARPCPECGEGWMSGTNERTGETGSFPSNYVELELDSTELEGNVIGALPPSILSSGEDSGQFGKSFSVIFDYTKKEDVGYNS